MRRRLGPISLMMSLCLLAACGGGGEERTTGEDLALQIQKEFASMTACAARVSLEADYGTRVFDCVLDAAYDQVTGGTLTVVEPEIAKGVQAHITREGASLRYEDFSLDTGDLTGQGLSPVEAVPKLYEAVSQGFVAGTALTGETLTVTYRAGDQEPGVGLETVVTFDARSHAPRAGELYWDGTRVIAAQVTEFQMMAPSADQG